MPDDKKELIKKSVSYLLLFAIILMIFSCILPWKTIFIKDEEKGEIFEMDILTWGVHTTSKDGGGYEERWWLYLDYRPTHIFLGPEYSYHIEYPSGKIIGKEANYPHSVLINDLLIMLTFPLTLFSILIGAIAIYDVEDRRRNRASPAWSIIAGVFGIVSFLLFAIGYNGIFKYATAFFTQNLTWSWWIILPLLAIILFFMASIGVGCLSFTVKNDEEKEAEDGETLK